MILNKIDDPRDNLERAKRLELVAFAKANGLDHITNEHPAIVIRAELRQRGLTNIKVPPRPLGAQTRRPGAGVVAQPPAQNAIEVNAAADLARQFAQQQSQPPPPPLDQKPAKPKIPPQEINVLRAECKRLGIRMERRDTAAKLKAKIAAHGQDAPQLRQ